MINRVKIIIAELITNKNKTYKTTNKNKNTF